MLVLDVSRPDTGSRVAGEEPSERDRQPPERYEPLPGFAELPGWLWRRAGRRLRLGAGVLLLAVIAGAVAVIPTLRETSQERAEAERRERAEQRAQLVRQLEVEQRPRFGRSESVTSAGAEPAERLVARGRLMDELAAAILDDARRRVRAGEFDGPIRRVQCEPFPRQVDGVGADRDLSSRRGRYSCVAVTSEIERSEASLGGVIGRQYRAQADFQTGRYAYCKISGQAGPSKEQLVTTPRACGGR